MKRLAYPLYVSKLVLALCLALIPLGLVLFHLPSPVVHASTLTVSDSGDGGAGTLRQAILDANDSGGDTIVFSLSYPPMTLTNSSVYSNTAGLGGGIANYNAGIITMTNDTVAANSTLNSGGGIDNTGILTLTNVTLANNGAGSGTGGIYNAGSSAPL